MTDLWVCEGSGTDGPGRQDLLAPLELLGRVVGAARSLPDGEVDVVVVDALRHAVEHLHVVDEPVVAGANDWLVLEQK